MGLAEEMRDMNSDGYMDAYENSKPSNKEPIMRYGYGPGIGKNFQTKMEVTNTLVNTNDVVYIVTMSNQTSDFGEYYFLMREFDGTMLRMANNYYDKESELTKRLIEFQVELSGCPDNHYSNMWHEEMLTTALNEITVLVSKNSSNNIKTHIYIEGPIECVQKEMIKDFAKAVIGENSRIILITPCGPKKL